jgi:hypothetical protein
MVAHRDVTDRRSSTPAGWDGSSDRRLVLLVGPPTAWTTLLRSRLEAVPDQLGDASTVRPTTPLPAGATSATRAGSSVVVDAGLAEVSIDHAREVVATFGDRHVDVVVAPERLDRVLPWVWQEGVRAGLRTPFAEWLADVCRGPGTHDGAAREFWHAHDPAGVAQRWASIVGVDHVTVVPVRPHDPAAVLGAFAELLALPAGSLDPFDHAGFDRPLTAVEAELLRRINVAITRPGGTRGLRRVLEARTPPADEARLGVPAGYLEVIRPLALDAVRSLRALGCAVVGDLDDLVPPEPAGTGDDGLVAPDEIPIDTAAAVIEAALGLRAT